MPSQRHSFKRLVLGLQPNVPSGAFQFAAGLAELLDVELLGLFLEDTSLRDLARMPFARELRPMNGGWYALDVEQLSRDINYAARNVEQMFAKATKNLGIRYQFEVARGHIGTVLSSLSRSSDIVMIVEPASPVERAGQQFIWLIEAAFRSAAAVMIVPPRLERTKGPVVAIVAGAADPSFDVAAMVAGTANEELVVIDIGESKIDDAEIRRRAETADCRFRHIIVASPHARSGTGALVHVLAPMQERLLVVTRGLFRDRDVTALASKRGVPTLVVEPIVAAVA